MRTTLRVEDSKTRTMTYKQLQELPPTSYIIVTYGDSVFKFYTDQVGESFWDFLSENATIIHGEDEENI